jgi:hypothetical protein
MTFTTPEASMEIKSPAVTFIGIRVQGFLEEIANSLAEDDSSAKTLGWLIRKQIAAISSFFTHIALLLYNEREMQTGRVS